MAQHEVEQQMAERLASDRHPQLAAVGEVHLRLATRGMIYRVLEPVMTLLGHAVLVG